MKAALGGLVVLFFVVGAACGAETYKLKGTVRDSKKSPAAGVNVMLVQPGTSFRRAARTDASGTYTFADIGPGNYQLVAQGGTGVAMQSLSIKADLAFDLQLGPPAQSIPSSSPSSSEATPSPSESFPELDFNLPQAAPGSAEGGAAPTSDTVTIVRSGGMPEFTPFGMGGFGDNEFRRSDRRANRNDRTRREMRAPMVARAGESAARPGGPPGGRGSGAGIMEGPGGGGMIGGGDGPGMVMISRMGGARANRLQGGVSLGLRSSLLDARPYALLGEEIPDTPYDDENLGFSLGGPLLIRKGTAQNRRSAPQFFLNLGINRGNDLYTAFSTVPTELESRGDFSRSRYASGQLAGEAVRIANPFRPGETFLGSVIPQQLMDPAASALLSFIPLPNLEGLQNYFINRRTGSRGTSFGLTFNVPLSNQIRFTSGLNIGKRSSDANNLFPGLGGKRDSTMGLLRAGINHTIRRGLVESINVSLSRNRVDTLNGFAFTRDLEGELGISGVSREPVNWGIPSIMFTNFGNLQDLNGSISAFQAFRSEYSLNWVNGYHSVRFGATLGRLLQNSISDPNGRGTFTFSGFATSAFDRGGLPIPGTGFDLADFLLGLPQSTTVRYGSPDSYLRNWEWTGYVEDNWKIHPQVTLSLGARYDLVTPGVERYDRLSNLDIAPDFTAAQVVLAGQTGVFSGALPRSLIFTDKNNFSPRVGFAFKPSTNRSLVVRAGYGISYNDTIYRQLTRKLVSQPPFAFSQRSLTQSDRVLTLRAGFPPDDRPITNSIAIDPHYRTGNVQNWNLSLQQRLPWRLVGTIAYQGSRGADLDLLRAPNRAPAGSPLDTESRRRIGDAQEFLYQSSGASSSLHSLYVTLQRRFSEGFMAGGNYTFGKAIDYMSSIGGGSGTVVQNDEDLRSERGLSGFDVRHHLSINSMWQLPFGDRKRYFSGPGLGRRILGGWSLSPGLDIHSGRPFTARISGNQINNSGTGSYGSERASVTGQPVKIDHSTTARFFNTGAFELPLAGRFGNAGRNTIPGPGSVRLNFILNRAFQVNERQRLMFSVVAINVTNHPNFQSIDTVVNRLSFGQVTSVGPMRQIRLNIRYSY